MHKQQKRSQMGSIQKRIFQTQLILIVSLTLFLGITGIVINIQFETKKRDQTLRNIADTIVQSFVLNSDEDNMFISEREWEYLDFLQNTVEDIDVISVVSSDGIRVFHTTKELVGTKYDGTQPQFDHLTEEYYITNDVGPSGTQRRAYAAVYSENGKYLGFVLAVSLMEHIYHDIFQIIWVFAIIMLAAIFMELLISSYLSEKIKKELDGYEPDVFSAMYRIRDNIIESLEEGIAATDNQGKIQFMNRAGAKILGNDRDSFCLEAIDFENNNVIMEQIPIREDGEVIGMVYILRDRAEYTKLMEDLAGTRYLVDSMRASNHDFTNKLHVILGLIQMEMYKEAESYIQNITVVQRETISKIMKAIEEPSLAALLIGKISRAAELNIKFSLRENSYYAKPALQLPAEALITIVGNLIDNAFEAMNTEDYEKSKELLFGIYSRQGEVLITSDDTGAGISAENIDSIFEKGFSTKGEGRGTGLYQVKTMVERMNGTITVESQVGAGTSFTVSIKRKDKESHV